MTAPNEKTVKAFGNVWTRCLPVAPTDVAACEVEMGPLPAELTKLFHRVASGRPQKNFFYDGKHEVMVGPVLSPVATSYRKDLCALYRRFLHQGMRRGLVPFALDIGNADPFCVDEVTGHVFVWNHDPAGETNLGVSLKEFLARLELPPF